MVKNCITIVLFFSAHVFSQDPIPICGTPDPTDEEIELANKSIDASLNNNQRTPDDDPVNVLVAWHVIHSSSGLGNIPDSQIQDAVDILNFQYNEVLTSILHLILSPGMRMMTGLFLNIVKIPTRALMSNR